MTRTRMLMLTGVCALLAIALAWTLAPRFEQDAKQPAATKPADGLLFTQTARHGTLTGMGVGNDEPRISAVRYELTLRDVAPQVVWFTDRPARHAGHLPAGALADRWAKFGFAADPPNAALTLLDAQRGVDTLVVELRSRPVYDARERTMRYVVRQLDLATGAVQAGHDSRFPRRFGDVSLFIDAADAEIDLCDADVDPDPCVPGDPDALPTIPATAPDFIPPDQGDGGTP